MLEMHELTKWSARGFVAAAEVAIVAAASKGGRGPVLSRDGQHYDSLRGSCSGR